MTDRIAKDARNIRKLVREAEALADESMIAFSRLKQAMLAARQNPAVGVDTGQRALLRLGQAEQQAAAMSSSLLRVHEELSRVARIVAIGDEDVPTIIQETGLNDASPPLATNG